ncbi:MAG TPA: redox-regulated ATPase YchF [Melioribacteraceae bacterium]|nr:redox-regulated ATPase YchF [Melioribacteraceae bacterium]
MQIGLVGLQYSGKTTLFNILAGIKSEEANQKEEANIAVVKVPDTRLDKLTEIFNPLKQVNATIEVYDIPGLRTSDEGKLRITSGFLNNVKNNDALFYVVRSFKNDSVPHPTSKIDPISDVNFLETEFLLTDMEFLEKRLEKIKKDIQKSKDDRLKQELPVIEKCYAHIEKELPLRTLGLEESEKKLLSGYQLLTLKPAAVAVNFDENSSNNIEEETNKISLNLEKYGLIVLPFFAKIEEELMDLDDDDRLTFMTDYGIKESAKSKILRILYQLLGLESFFTAGEDECRAWTIKKNYTAQQSAGVIHTDFYNKFIRAEVVSYENFIEHKSFAKCKENGTWRLEGKDYIVKDGDILTIRHS